MSIVVRDERRLLDPDARARLIIVGVLIVVVSIVIGLMTSSDGPPLRGSIDAIQAMTDAR